METNYVLDHLKTSRLVFRKVRASDADQWMDFFNSPDALRYLPFKLNSRSACEEWLEKQMVRYKESRSGLCVLIERHTGNMIGQCGLLVQEIRNKQELEISYHLLPGFWKRGYATEAATAVRDHAFKHDFSDSLISIIHVENINSQKVAERIGMKRELKTEWRGFPIYIYRIYKDDWNDFNK